MGMIVDCKSTNTLYTERSDIFNSYIADINRYPLLSAETQRKLIAQAQKNKDKNNQLRQQAIDKLIGSNQLFVMSVAKKYATNDNLLDLINEGNIGLLQAIDEFDVKRPHKFLTYAVWWVRKKIIDYIATKVNMMKPANASKIYNFSKTIKNEFFIKNERYPTLEELRLLIKERYKLNIENVGDLEAFQVVSISDYSSTEEEEIVGDSYKFSQYTATNNVEDDCNNIDTKSIIKILLETLKEREKYIIKRVYGIGCEETSLDTIATDLGISRERVRQIVVGCLNKMRSKHQENLI